jgi:2-oxoisovalerate dehydrogenase E1 component
VQLCEKTADALRTVGCDAEVIDLRWLSPWDHDAAIESARKTKRVLVVHEDNQTCGFGAEVLATVSEAMENGVRVRRVTRPDTYVPCHFGNQLEILPSFKRVLSVAEEMLDLDLSWETGPAPQDGLVVVDAIGSSPADESVTIVEFKVGSGDIVVGGDLLASLECDKALFDLTAPVSGVVETLHAKVGQTIRVGESLLTIRTGGTSGRIRQPVRENAGTPLLRRRK